MTVADVIHNVKCELYLAILQTPNTHWLVNSGWAAKFQIVVKVRRETGLNGELTLVVPYADPAPGLLTITAGGRRDKSSEANMSFYFFAGQNLGDFMSKNQCDFDRQLLSRRNLAGETGLQIWFVNVIEGINQAKIQGQMSDFSYNLEFETTLEGRIEPSFTHLYPSGRIFSGDFGARKARTDTNQLEVNFVRSAPPAPAFAATELGKQLARIERELRQLRAQQAKLEDEQRFGPLGDSELALLKATEDRIKTLQTDRSDVAAAAAAVAAVAAAEAAARPDLATQQQLNTLSIINAIRNIPR